MPLRRFILSLVGAALLGLASVPTHALVGKGIFNCGGYPRGANYGLNDPNVAGKELLFEWREIEPEEGVYAWELIDDAMNPWADAGKVVAIRIMSACNDGSASPLWVFEKAGVPKVVSSEFSPSNIVFPVFWDPVFEQKYSAMVRAFAARYDGNPAVEFVQVGGVGRWEETYVHTENDRMSRRWQERGYTHKRYIAHCKKMADVFRRAFRRTPVLLSISIGGPDAKTSDRKSVGFQLADYAVKHGLYLKQNGWGAHYSYTDHDHFSRIFVSTRGLTKRIYEQGAPTSEPWSWEKGTFRSSVNRALLDCPDYLWIYETDLARPEFRRDIAWARNHLSMRSYREAGPLWIRFREMHPHLENPAWSPVIQDEYNGLLAANPRAKAPPDTKLQPARLGGIDCKTTSPEFPAVYLDVEDSAILQEAPAGRPVPSALMDITFWDEGSSPIRIEHSWNATRFLSLADIPRTDMKTWKTASVHLSALRFRTELSVAEPDFRISAADGYLALSRIQLRLNAGLPDH